MGLFLSGITYHAARATRARIRKPGKGPSCTRVYSKTEVYSIARRVQRHAAEVLNTKNPFEVLGLNAGASADDVRNAYRQLVKTCHPDKFLDADERKAAQEKMIALNLAYEEALKLTASRRSAATNYNRELTVEEAIALADKMLRRDSPEAALRHLMRTKNRTGAWFAMQGHVLMVLEEYESSHQSYREAVRREPNNNVFRQGALDAAVALKKSRTPMGRVKTLLKRLKRK